MIKRSFDFLVSACALLLLALPIVLVALAVRLTSPGPVLYWSDRVGRDNRIFRMPKFRSMRTDTPAVATHLLDSPERWLSPIGSFLRRTSLDELPQLWSVLKGDMSLVGPRPAFPHELERYELWHKRKLCVRPGITCLWQVRGRNRISKFDDWVRMDLEYIDNWSLWLDVKIAFMTIPAVLRGRGAK
jgi:O-antigen biosynthesis protein WbqP